MSFWIYFGIYTFCLVIIWGFFIVSKIHSLKFKNYQPKIVGLTNGLTFILAALTILGYLLIFFNAGDSNTYELNDTVDTKSTIQSEIDNFSDISDKDELIPVEAGEDYY